MTVDSERHVTFRKTCVGQSVRGISFNCFPEILDCMVEAFCGSLAPMESSLQVQMIGLSVLGISLGQTMLFLGRQLQPQFFRDLLRDVFLNRKDVRGFSSILVAPQLPAVVYVHQLGADQKHVTALKNTARQYSPDSELRPDVLCFIAPALVSKYRASRHHTEFGQLRKAEDNG